MNANFLLTKSRLHKSFTLFFFNLIVLIISLVILFPLFWIVVTSMKGQSEIITSTLSFFPKKNIFLDNLRQVLFRAPWSVFYANTMTVAFGVLIFQLAVSIPAAYAFVFLKFRFKNFFFLLVLARLLVSPETLLLPNYLTITSLNLYNTLLGIGLPSIASAISILMFRTAFLEIPSALKDSAEIDGCGDFQFMLRIGIPCIKSRIIAFSITSLIYQWNSYFWPMVVTESINKRTLAVGMAYFGLQAESASEWGLTMTAALLVIFPLIIALLIFQKQLVNSFVTSGIK